MRNRRQLFAEVMPEDHTRVCAIARAAGMTQSAFVRMCIDDWLEDVGEPALATAPGASKQTSSKGP